MFPCDCGKPRTSNSRGRLRATCGKQICERRHTAALKRSQRAKARTHGETLRTDPVAPTAVLGAPNDAFLDWFDTSKALPPADRVVSFIETFCRHVKGQHAGKPFILADWQKDEIIRPLYGNVDDQGRRLYRLAWMEMPRKQGKSALLSALALYHLMADGESGAEVYSVACDRDQASLVYDVARRMVEHSPVLSEHVEIVKSRKELRYGDSVYKVLPGDAAGALGVNASAVLFDEVLTQRDRHLWDAMRQSFGTRLQPLLVAATTAAYTTAEFAKAEHDYSLEVLTDPAGDPSRFVFIRNLPEDWPYEDEGQPPSAEHPKGTGWHYALPALGDFFSIETLRDELREAKRRPQALQAFRVFRLNQWVTSVDSWLDISIWDDNGQRFDPETLRGRRCYAGLDLASVQDFTAWVLLFPGSPTDPEADGFTVLPRFFLPRPALESRNILVPRFLEWEERGYLTVTEGQTTDYGAVLDQITKDAEAYSIGLIGYDPWNATHLISLLEDRGQTTVKVPQTMARLTDPTKQLESLLADRRMAHGGHPVLRWMAENIQLDTSGEGLVKPSKKRSGEKIDGIVALINALFVASVPVEDEPEVRFYPSDGELTDEGRLAVEALEQAMRELDAIPA